MSTHKVSRYIFRELLVPTLLGLAVFTFILLSGRALKLAELVVNKGVPLAEVGHLILLLLPSLLVFTLPLSLLLGVLLGVGRLSADSEVTAMKASGISLYAMLRPVLLLAVMVSLLTGLMTLWALPPSYHGFRNRLFQLAQQRATVGLQAGRFNEDFAGLMLYAEELQEESGVMSHLLLTDRRDPGVPALIAADSGQLLSQPEEQKLLLRLTNGTIHRQREGATAAYQVIRFSQYDVQLDLGQPGQALGQRALKEKELPWGELRQAAYSSERPHYLAELHRRLALPLAPIALAFIGLPLSLGRHRSGRGAGFSLALLTFLAYYLLLSLAGTLAETGKVPPGLALWMPNGLFLTTGLWLFWRAAEERTAMLPTGFSRWWRRGAPR